MHSFVAWHDGPPTAWLDPCLRTFELNLEHEPWNDKEMRWALNYYIDRAEIVEIAYENTAILADHIFVAYPPLLRYVDLARDADLYERYPLGDYNPEVADATLESKGYVRNADEFWEKDGEVLSILITTHEGPIELQRIAQVMNGRAGSACRHRSRQHQRGRVNLG